MDLEYPSEVQEFADEVRDFVRNNLPPEIRDKVLSYKRVSRDEQIYWQRKLCDKGYAAPSWPEEFDGPGWSPIQRHIYEQVTAEEGAPPAMPFGESMIAPVLMKVGTKEQQEHYLPRIRTLEYYFCQGFSEPGAGSDLASLKTHASLSGDEWIINGQKMWTSFAHNANMIFLLARTDPSVKLQDGISMFMFPLDSKGTSVRPIMTIDGHHHTNEVFLDNVRVPRSSIIGETNKGWTYAKLLLGHERHTIARIGEAKRDLRLLKTLVSEQCPNGAPSFFCHSFRGRVARIEIELLALEITALRMIGASQHENAPGIEANMLKIKGSEIRQGLAELLLEAVGPFGLPFDPNDEARRAGNPAIGPRIAASLGPHFLSTRVLSIYGGSNEIQRNIIAKSLGL